MSQQDQANTQAEWSDWRHWQAGNITAREAIDASAHRAAFMGALAKFTAKANRYERVEVMWWTGRLIYVGVCDGRYKYPISGRALVSFDLDSGQWASYDSPNRYVYARRGWRTFLGDLIHYDPPLYSEGTEKERGPNAPRQAQAVPSRAAQS